LNAANSPSDSHDVSDLKQIVTLAHLLCWGFGFAFAWNDEPGIPDFAFTVTNIVQRLQDGPGLCARIAFQSLVSNTHSAFDWLGKNNSFVNAFVVNNLLLSESKNETFV